jgi:lysyl-tRNA synthetase class 1
MGEIPERAGSPIAFGMLLNLASVINADNAEMLWGFIRRYLPNASPEVDPFLARLVDHALVYYADFVRPKKRFRAPDATERAGLEDLARTLAAMPADSTAEAIQDEVYAVGKRHPFPSLKAWFMCLYQVLLGQEEGPRFGGFVALYGIGETVGLIERRLAPAPEAALA